jgi:hypothetical protein
VGAQTKLPALKIPRQYPHVLLINVKRKQGKPLGTEEGKASGNGQFFKQRKEAKSLLNSFRFLILTM